MSAAFTPGPWLTTGTTVYSLFFARGHERNKWDCTIYGDLYCPRDELQANAHLIAAAPELYAALLLAQAYLHEFAPAAVYDANEVLLRKARGEA